LKKVELRVKQGRYTCDQDFVENVLASMQIKREEFDAWVDTADIEYQV
jgi:hypothetical protein